MSSILWCSFASSFDIYILITLAAIIWNFLKFFFFRVKYHLHVNRVARTFNRVYAVRTLYDDAVDTLYFSLLRLRLCCRSAYLEMCQFQLAFFYLSHDTSSTRSRPIPLKNALDSFARFFTNITNTNNPFSFLSFSTRSLQVETTDNEIMLTGNQKTPTTTTSTTTTQPVSGTAIVATATDATVAESSSSSSMDANPSSQNEMKSNDEKANIDVTQLPSSSTQESTIDNEKIVNGGAETSSNDNNNDDVVVDDNSMKIDESSKCEDKESISTSPSDLNKIDNLTVDATTAAATTATDANRTNPTPVDAIEQRIEQVQQNGVDEKREAQCDSVDDSLKMCNDSGRPDADVIVAVVVSAVSADGESDSRGQVNGGENEKCNENDKNDSNCDSSDSLGTDVRRRTETSDTSELNGTSATITVTLKSCESEMDTTVNCTNESNNNDINEVPKIVRSETDVVVAPTTDSKSNETKSTSEVHSLKSEDVKSEATQAADKGGGRVVGESSEVPPRNGIGVSVIAESKIKKTCDLIDEHARVAASRPSHRTPEPNAITSSSAVTEMDAPADTRKHSNDVIALVANSYERKVIVSPPKSSVYHQSQPTVVEPKSRPTSSMYVSAPDFTKQLHAVPVPAPTASNLRDLSPLRMKPPDFSKLCRTTELHVSNPDFSRAYDRVVDARPKVRALTEVNASNFAEISKKYNYVSDLQLKNPLPATTTSSTPSTAPSSASSSSSSMYVRPPDFSSSKVRSRMETPTNVEEPAAHVIHKPKFRIQADSSSKPSPSASPAAPIRTEFPQISHDVTMSLVSSQPSNASAAMQNGNEDASFYAARHERHRYPTPVEHANSHGYYAAAAAAPPRSTNYAEDVHRQSVPPNFHSMQQQQLQQQQHQQQQQQQVN